MFRDRNVAAGPPHARDCGWRILRQAVQVASRRLNSSLPSRPVFR
jgi:hypothetical protein